MDWYKQRTGYYLDAKMIDAGEEAEVLHQRAKAYAAEHETSGFIPAGALVYITPKRPRPRAEALVRAGLWLTVAGGYLIAEWDDEQAELEALAARRRSDRERKRTQRERATSRDISADMSRDSHVTDASCEQAPSGRQTNVSVKAEQNTASYRPVYPRVTGESETDKSAPDSANAQASEPQRENTSRDIFEDKESKSKKKRTTTYSPSSADADDGAPTTKTRSKKRAESDGFDAFWQAYPRRVGKLAAEKAYAKALAAGATPDLIISGARFYAMEKKLTDPQYIKHPSTWLNAGCWQDEPDPVYKPPVITGPSEAATAMPPPAAATLAEQAAHGRGTVTRADQIDFSAFDFGRMPG